MLSNISVTACQLHDCSSTAGIAHIQTLTSPTIRNGEAHNSFTFHPDVIIYIGDYSCTGQQLAANLKLLDTLIAQHYPELLV